MKSISPTAEQADYVYFKLTLVRHAETNANADGIIQGMLDTELSDIGYKQAEVLGRHLEFHRFSHIYSSDLKRASETARIVYKLNRVSSCEINYDSLLRERMFGIAQGQTRQWLHELAKNNGVPYANFTPPGGETIGEVRDRAIAFFRKLCREMFIRFGTSSLFTRQDTLVYLKRHVSVQCLFPSRRIFRRSLEQRSSSIENLLLQSKPNLLKPQSSIDLTSDIASPSFPLSIGKRRHISKTYQCSGLDILVVSHGAIIRELIKYFACDLQTNIGKHFDSIQDLAPNTSITCFQVNFSIDEQFQSTATLELNDYHNRSHLINQNNGAYNLNTINKCSL